jgi:diadenosine tetraphosphatase ApaH/serine/threonine PP2A family protein phosphatase
VGRAIIIGDVHGCIDELRDLIVACSVVAADRLFFVGDLVAKGPDSHAVVTLVRSLRAVCVRGNHDERFVKAHLDRDPSRLSPGQRRDLAELSAEDLAFLAATADYHELPEHGVVIVHAGLVPGVPLTSQERDHMLTLRSILPDGTPTKRIEGGVPWASRWRGPPHVVFGHDAVRGLQRYPDATGLDTGCVYGGALTALVLPARELVSVPARRAWTSVS